MLSFYLQVKPISVNAAYRGRRFKTRECAVFCRHVDLQLPRAKVLGEYFEVHIKYGLVNFSRTDEDNLIKVLQDCIITKGIISDDRRIVKHVIEKFPSDTDLVYVVIKAVDKPKPVTKDGFPA